MISGFANSNKKNPKSINKKNAQKKTKERVLQQW